MELIEARQIAQSVLNAARPACLRAEVAGSVRREKSNVKDIELVIIVNDYDDLYVRLATCGRFIKPGVPDIIDWPPKTGAKYIRMLLNEGVKLDIFVANSDNWGALFCMRTGSGVGPDGSPFSGFIPTLFRRWKKVSKGGRMVNCMPTMPDGLQLSVPEERDFFELLGVEWVEPKDRIDRKAVKVIP
jgi:DNA polymerase/3'-5' exonuclease PolX